MGRSSRHIDPAAVQLTSVHHGCIGFFVGAIEQSIMRPSVFWKAMLQQQKFNLAQALNPRYCYRGLPVAVASIAPITCIQFSANSASLCAIQAARGKAQCSDSERMFAGVFAGVVSAVVQSPCQLVEVNQQNFGGTVSSTARAVIREHGVAGLFRGVSMTMVREGVFCCSYIALQPMLQAMLHKRRPKLSENAAVAGSSVATGVLGAAISHPADTFKTRLQGGMFNTGPDQVRRVRDVARQLQMSPGGLLSGCYAGFTPRCFRLICCTYIYSNLNAFFEERLRQWLAPSTRTPMRVAVEAGSADLAGGLGGVLISCDAV
mmetsp:Transcript_2911/g.7592  ORF Transcript_2911/g.7592 Transcript_2911/m.7592 type:complete len:319 (-) Transcript_2911:74-1030(-)